MFFSVVQFEIIFKFKTEEQTIQKENLTEKLQDWNQNGH